MGVNRTHLVTTKDVQNIRRAFGLKRVEKHPDDTTSVALLIKAEENFLIILHKFLGQPHVGVSDEGSQMKDEDVMIVIQTRLVSAALFPARCV